MTRLDTRPRGALLRPRDDGYDRGRAAWNRNARQTPAVVVMAVPADGAVLVNTSRMSGVRVVPGPLRGRQHATGGTYLNFLDLDGPRRSGCGRPTRRRTGSGWSS
jgi:hypothetical protein